MIAWRLLVQTPNWFRMMWVQKVATNHLRAASFAVLACQARWLNQVRRNPTPSRTAHFTRLFSFI